MCEGLNLNQYINTEIPCKCGRKHYFPMKMIDINPGALERLPESLEKMGYKKPFIVEDMNTYGAAGKAVEECLTKANIPFDRVLLKDEDDLIPDERIIGTVVAAYKKDCDVILAVGAGTINDLCKFVSTQLRVDYICFATAPSMDGFVSNGAAMMIDHVKTSFDSIPPVAVIGDTKILSQAPMLMITAGLADTLGKYTCLLDWKLSHIINGEYYCEEIVGMVQKALSVIMAQKDKIADRDEQVIKAVTEALVLTGIAMSFVGYSRPASGCEHHLSHLWEMRFIMEGKKAVLHGTKVGIGMIAALHMYQDLAKESVDFAAAKEIHFDETAFEEKMKEVYGDAAAGVIALEKKTHKNADLVRKARVTAMEENWNLIVEQIQKDLPLAEDMEKLLSSLGAPIRPQQIGIDQNLFYDGICYAKEVRDRYTLLGILGDLGLSTQYAENMIKLYYDTKDMGELSA